MNRTIPALLAVLSLAGCARTIQVASAVCQRNAALQQIVVPLAVPVTVALAPSAAPVIGQIVAIDQTVLNPAIVAACAGVNARATDVVVK